jgi:hypothetical protein
VSLGVFNTTPDIDRLIDAIRADNTPSPQGRKGLLSNLG